MSTPTSGQPSSPSPLRITRRLACRLAAAADVDFRTAMKALRFGIDAVRGRPAERLAEAAPALGIPLGQHAASRAA